MSRSDATALDDILAAITSIPFTPAADRSAWLIVMDAVAMRLLEIAEAVKALSAETTDAEPAMRWREIAGMRDFVAHPSQPTPRLSKR
ncbi:MAG: HepT-like ribonuclease domain-containing protein [Actinomycetales bacterium]